MEFVMKKKLSFILMCLFISSTIFAQAVLQNDVLLKVRSSVFEVVVDKYEDTTISYEKKLPMERIPFAIRNDKYTPIGTAFLLEDGTFYSAAHVITLYGDSYKTDYYLRDADGNTYPIDEITSFSNTRDYISFTVPDYEFEEGMGLKINEKAKMNTNVFSVGNALGEGIIIRNGILTSRTYEMEAGEWQWLRFSAAASPGNSGGPLINEEGEVIGIITMKSENENLNYALPIAETKNDPENTGIIKSSVYYRLPNVINEKELDDFKTQIKLPMKYKELHSQLTSEYKEFIKKTFDKMKEEYGPNGKGGYGNSRNWPDFAFYSYSPSFPYTVYKDDSGDWDLGNNNTKSYALKDNGNVYYTSMMNYFVAVIEKPDSISLKELLSSPKTYMDYCLEAYKLQRSVGSEQVALTSFGEPCKQESYTDYFGRTWQVTYYDVKFADAMLVCYALPTPTGVYLMYMLDSISEVLASHYLDMQYVADSYYSDMFGKVKNWKEYFELPESLVGKRPAFMNDLIIETKDNNLNLKAGPFQVSLTEDVFKTDDETKIDIITGFNKDSKGNVALEIKGFTVYNSTKTEDYKYFSFRKFYKPSEDAKKQITQNWEQFINKVSPYNGEPYNSDQYTYLDSVFVQENAEESDFAYIMFNELKNQNRFEEIKEFSEKVRGCTKFN